MAIEDAAALGIIFSPKYWNGSLSEAMQVYEEIRLPRATKVQAAAQKAAQNINERIGFSTNTECATYKVDDEKQKLTIEEMNYYDMYKDVEEKLAKHRGQSFKGWHHGLPIGMKLPNGVTVGEQ